jgi:LemA protein
MTSSVLSWAVIAVLLFWAVGAYNRLMRLRADVHTSFGALHAELMRHVELVRADLGGAFQADAPAWWAPLEAAAGQLTAALASARHKPLDASRIAALSAAQDVVRGAWERAERDDAHDLRGPRLPDGVLGRRAQLALHVHGVATQFNGAVTRYNEAIAQFPAVLLAWVFGFKPARGVAVPAGAPLG